LHDIGVEGVRKIELPIGRPQFAFGACERVLVGFRLLAFRSGCMSVTTTTLYESMANAAIDDNHPPVLCALECPVNAMQVASAEMVIWGVSDQLGLKG